MTYTSTLTNRNQTTIPQAVVKALRAQPSATLCFEMEPDGRILLSAKTSSFAELSGTFPKKKRSRPATVEEINQAAKEGAAARLKRSRP